MAPRRLHLGATTALVALGLVAAVEAWAWHGVDRDFYLPDPFRPLALALVLAFALTAFVQVRPLRRVVRTLAIVVALATLLLEARVRYRELGQTSRVERTADPLLRYHYRPGAEAHEIDRPELVVNHLGLLEDERAIPKPAGVLRIAVLTGSIANDTSVPFEQRFVRKLEHDLAGAAPDGRRVETVNVSCEGYNTTQQVRLLEQVGLQYQPDLVVLAYMMTSASVQDGSYRRLGNSFFLFRFLPMLARAEEGSVCAVFAPYHERYTFDLIVRQAMERLDLLGRVHGFDTLVAVLPVVERFDDPTCARLYDKVVATSRAIGFDTVRVADAFVGEPPSRFAKPGMEGDVCHPNVDGHARIAKTLADAVRKHEGWPAAPAR